MSPTTKVTYTTNPVAARLRAVSAGAGSQPNSKIKDLCSDGAAEIERQASEIERLLDLLKRWLELDGDRDDIANLIGESWAAVKVYHGH